MILCNRLFPQSMILNNTSRKVWEIRYRYAIAYSECTTDVTNENEF